MIRLDDIVDEVQKYNPQADVELLQQAYIFSAKAHKGQRDSQGNLISFTLLRWPIPSQK